MADQPERLGFVCRPGATTRSAPRVSVSGMGDGYDERKPTGLNSDQKDYSLEYVISSDIVKFFRDFMDRQGAVKAFEIFSPSRKKWVLVICSTWSEQTNFHYSTFTLSCSEVNA